MIHVADPYGKKNTAAKQIAVPTKQMMKGMRIFLNTLANTTGNAMEAMQAMTVLSVDMSPAMGVMAGSPMSVVTAATM